MTDLNPCPCCGSTKIHVVAPDDGCYCWECGLTMPKRPNWMERWNRRATNPESLHDTMKKYREKCGEPVVDDRTVE